MSRQRDIRRCALQALYQFDVGNASQPEMVRSSLEESPGDEKIHQAGFDLAAMAWEFRDEADRTFADYSTEWPTYRRPVIDRSLLRLAFYEMTRTETPRKVVINECVELAKEFSTEKSHLFINGVLDKFYRSIREISDQNASADSPVVSPDVSSFAPDS